MSVDAAFKGAGQKPGVEIWRIENFKVVAVPKETHGKFFAGDSYIILHTKQRPGSSSYEWDIHFWLGKDSSQDEMGTAAYKTVELDESLGGGPVQYREVQGHETPQFLSVFKGGVEYMDGGVASGFKKVEKDKYDPRLLHLKGARNVRVNAVPVSGASLNEGDVFILDLGLTIYQWNGPKSSKQEKAKGVDVGNRIKDEERKGRAKFILLDGGDAAAEADFWKALGGKPAKIKSAEEGGDDAKAEASVVYVLYKVSDASGSLQVEEVGRGKLNKNMLDTNDCFILDGDSELFVWVGKGATAQERKESMIHATNYLKQNNKPSHTPITRVAEGGETPLFKGKFSVWPEPVAKGPVKGGNVAKVTQQKVDVGGLHAKKAQEKEAEFDDGKGKLEIWRVENFKPVPVDKNMYGQFYSGDSYVLLYTYMQGTKEAYVIYFWQGLDSSQDERGASALIAKDMDDARGGAPVQVRVVQGKEPNHFLRLFKGKFIIHEGGKASGFKNQKAVDSFDTDGVSLFHVRGTNDLNTRAVQVAEKAASLNSNDVFVLLTPATMFVWAGTGANADERKNGESIANVLKFNRKLVKVEEGKEPAEFWSALGGKGEYASEGFLSDQAREPRLFQCSNASGQFTVEELFNFGQDDLDQNDIFILDTFNEVYVWVGDKSNDTEKKMAFETAIEFVKTATDGRSPDTPIIKVVAGHEPKLFSCNFLGWDEKRAAAKEDPAEAKLRAAKGGAGPSDVRAASAVYSTDRKIPLADLQKGNPEGIDATKKELYLSDSDFQAVFKMKRDEFAKLPAWKQGNLKKAANLF